MASIGNRVYWIVSKPTDANQNGPMQFTARILEGRVVSKSWFSPVTAVKANHDGNIYFPKKVFYYASEAREFLGFKDD